MNQPRTQPVIARRVSPAWGSALGILFLVASFGCAAPPEVHLHTLMPSERPLPRDAAGAGSGTAPAVLVEGVTVPAQVDQPQWLIRRPDGTLTLLEQERWAGPLADELHQALLEILRTRFGATEAPSTSVRAPIWRLRVDVTRFETLPGETRHESTWTLSQPAAGSSALRCTTYIRESAGSGMPALAEAHRRAVRRLGEAIGEQLLALHRGEPGRCPPEVSALLLAMRPESHR